MNPETIKAEIRSRFARLALSPEEERTFAIGAESAKKLGYDAAEIDALPPSVTASFAGVGNPLGLGETWPGMTVLDLGSGAGLDCILAARRIGQSGTVIGIDFSFEMIERARRNAEAAEVVGMFQAGDSDALPLAGGCVDLALSNGVFNLCVDKPRVLSELYRVLRPGGRLQMADILLDDAVMAADVELKGAWSS